MNPKRKPKPLTTADVSTIKMVSGGEDKISRVIHEGHVKNWVGFGWVTERAAKPADYFVYPEVLECQQQQKSGKSSSPKKTRKRCSSTTSTKR